MYLLTSTFNKTFDDIGLIYFVPNFLEKEINKWQIVEIPVWTKIEIAVVLKIWSLEEINTLKINESKIKSIINIKNDLVFLNDKQIKLALYISKYYFTLLHNSISLFFPKNLRDKIVKNKLLINDPNKKITYIFNFTKQLSTKQNNILEEINSSEEKKFLLHWVTGSWKTEIYIKLIKQQLDLWKQSLLLIPEIILTNQLELRLKKVFWESILVINSSITEASKTQAWLSIHNWESKIIIWTRSSLFYPYNNLWLLIIDEHHDSSYISDNTPRYNSIEVAEKITKLNWNILLLASWTPSIKYMYKAIKGEYVLLKLLEKFEK